MATLQDFQREADKVATRLGITDVVTVRWAETGTPCKIGPRGADAHCHVTPEERFAPGYPHMVRGTICINARYERASDEAVRDLMRHEVAHLAAKGKHGLSFKKVLASLEPTGGFARQLKRQGVLAHRHRFKANPGFGITVRNGKVIIKEQCHGCGTSQDAEYRKVR